MEGAAKMLLAEASNLYQIAGWAMGLGSLGHVIGIGMLIVNLI